MTLVRFEPWNVMNRLNRRIDQILADSVAVPYPAAAGEAEPSWVPSVDVHEFPDRFVVLADLPGVEAKDIDITADHGVLTLKGLRQFERRENQQGLERLERVSGRFLRRFTLPENVETDQIKARQNNGVLELTIPKVAAAEPRRVSVETH
jgi:HSP20 family protein